MLGGFTERDRVVNFGYRSNRSTLPAAHHRCPTVLLDYRTRDVTKEQALFGQLTWHFTDDVWATSACATAASSAGSTLAGGYTSDYLTLAYYCSFLGICGLPATVAPVDAAEGLVAKETGPSYRVSASWRPTPSITTYAAVATGFRAPVVNARAGAVSTIDPDDLVIPFGADSDDLVSYEVGLKGRWWNGRLAANIALFNIDWNDIQAGQPVSTRSSSPPASAAPTAAASGSS